MGVTHCVSHLRVCESRLNAHATVFVPGLACAPPLGSLFPHLPHLTHGGPAPGSGGTNRSDPTGRTDGKEGGRGKGKGRGKGADGSQVQAEVDREAPPVEDIPGTSTSGRDMQADPAAGSAAMVEGTSFAPAPAGAPVGARVGAPAPVAGKEVHANPKGTPTPRGESPSRKLEGPQYALALEWEDLSTLQQAAARKLGWTDPPEKATRLKLLAADPSQYKKWWPCGTTGQKWTSKTKFSEFSEEEQTQWGVLGFNEARWNQWEDPCLTGQASSAGGGRAQQQQQQTVNEKGKQKQQQVDVRVRYVPLKQEERIVVLLDETVRDLAHRVAAAFGWDVECVNLIFNSRPLDQPYKRVSECGIRHGDIIYLQCR